MPVTTRRRHGARSRTLALCCTLLTALAPTGASASDRPVITVAEPEGFSDLTGEQTVLVDVYFGGQRRGDTRVVVAPGAISFAEPDEVLEMLPALSDRDAVAAALAAERLPAHSQLVCSPAADRAECGRLAPETVGVIFDRDRFRLDVFLNPRLLAVNESFAEQYLPAPAAGLSMVNSVGAVLSGRSGSGGDYYSLFDHLVLAAGERRLRANVSYATELGVEVERLALEWDRPGLRYSGGALWAPGTEISGRRKLLGFGIETQTDTRLDKDGLIGTPVVLYLDQRARVDVMRDGRVLYSAIYEAGNQQVETSSLPEGSYDIVLRIEEAGRPAREERRFFTKSRRIPAVGRTDFFAFGGVLVDDLDGASLDPSSHPYGQAGVARRLSRVAAVDAGILATDGGAAIELGATWLTRIAQVRAAAVADLEGTHGGIVRIASAGTSQLNFNIDLRHIELGDGADGLGGVPPAPSAVSPVTEPISSYSQISGIVSYSLPNVRMLGTFSYRDEDADQARYSFGPSLEWDMLRKGPFTVTLRGDMAVTERGKSGFVGVSLRFVGRRSSLTALAGGRASGIADDERGDGAVAAVSGAWNTALAGGELALGAGLDHQPRQDAVILSSEFRHRLGSLAGDFVRSENDARGVSQYSLGFQTTFAAGAGIVEIAGEASSESMIVARVKGAREDDRFEVLVNEAVVGTLLGAEALTLPLPAYRAYQVRIRPTGEDLLAYDSSPRKVGLYPGAVAKLEWAVSPVTIRIGRLVAPDGTPVRGASITGSGVWSETDEEGRFQIEAADDAELLITLSDGRSYPARLPRGEAGAGIVRLGAVVCCGPQPVTLGALELTN